MKPWFLFAALLFSPLASRANDSSFEGVGGTMRPTRGENGAIRMRSESVVLTANPDDFSTRAEFVFQNETARSQSVSMGFPEGNYGDVSSDGPLKKSTFKGFATFVDGRRIEAKRTLLKAMDDGGFDTYWIKTVSFAPHQTRRVRVEFRSPYGGNANWGTTRSLSYAFTGKNWRGDVAQSKLEVRVTQPGLWRVLATGNGEKTLPMSVSLDKNGAIFRRVWNNWQAQEGVTIGLERAIPFWRMDATGSANDSQTLRTVAATQTVRVGQKSPTIEPSQGIPTDGFVRDGTFYVRLGHLENRLEEWGQKQKPALETALTFSTSSTPSGASQFDLRCGQTRIQGSKGQNTLQVNGKTLALGAPIIEISHESSQLTYVPLAPIARALGWKLALRGERLFSLERGSWRG